MEEARQKMPVDRARPAESNARVKKLPAQHRSNSEESAKAVYVPDHVLGDPDMSGFGERIHSRLAAYYRLYDHAIPPNLVAALIDLRRDAPVTWVTKNGCQISETEKFAIPVVEPKKYQKVQTDSRNRNLEAVEVPLLTPLPRTADEALAMCLRERLAALRQAPKGSPPVRYGKMLSRSEIATIAVDMLAWCRASSRAPTLHLVSLVKELLEVDRPKASGPENFMARYQASWIDAQLPHIGPSVVARMVGVPTSSVSRWRRDRRFQNDVVQIRDFLNLVREHNVSWKPNRAIGIRVPVRGKRY
jgi:hypothetical protein